MQKVDIQVDRGTNMSIEKLEYRRRFFDISVMKDGARKTTTITNDGTIISKNYQVGSRKVDSVQRANCSLEDFKKLCDEIEFCIEEADRLDFYVDDSSEELKIYYEFGRVQTVDRGLGNSNTHIGEIINDFLTKYLPSD